MRFRWTIKTISSATAPRSPVPGLGNPRGLLLSLLVALMPAGCTYQHVGVESIPMQETLEEAAGQPVRVSSAVKAHLVDGSTVVYAEGVTVTSNALSGPGVKYDLALSNASPVTTIPLAEVVAMESFASEVEVGKTLVASIGGAAAIVLGGSALAVAIFGSCPTIYADSPTGAVLESEAFSYSIAPLFEARDVDRLGAVADANGIVALEVRNEALETHYIN